MTHMGLSLSALGITLLSIRGFDAFIDPIIGLLSDRYQEKRAYILSSGIILLVMAIMVLFNPIMNHVFLSFALALAMATFSFSLLTINLNSLGSLWANDSHNKTRITVWRETFGITGLLIGALVPAFLMQFYPTKYSFFLFSLFQITLLLISLPLIMHWYKRYMSTATKFSSSVPSSFSRHHFQKPYGSFFLVYGLSALASAIPAILVMTFIRDRINAPHLTGLFLLLYFITALAGMPLWQHLAKRYSKMKSWIAAMMLSVISFSCCVFVGSHDIFLYGFICLLSGLALGAELSLPPSLLSELIEKGNQQTHTSFYFSIFTFLTKFSIAAGSGFVFLLLDIYDFKPATLQSVHSLYLLTFFYAGLPCLIKIIAAITAISFYPSLTGESRA